MFTLVDDFETVRRSSDMQTDDQVIHSVYGRPIEILLVEVNNERPDVTCASDDCDVHRYYPYSFVACTPFHVGVPAKQ